MRDPGSGAESSIDASVRTKIASPGASALGKSDITFKSPAKPFRHRRSPASYEETNDPGRCKGQASNPKAGARPEPAGSVRGKGSTYSPSSAMCALVLAFTHRTELALKLCPSSIST